MAFDLGFNFRGSSGYVTDSSACVPVLNQSYPHTYTAANGYSVNAGFDTTAADGNVDRANTNDARIAGMHYKANNGTPAVFRVDLSSGSAPGAGAYTVDFAIGEALAGEPYFVQLYDNATQLIDGTNGGSGINVAAGHYVDATLADVAATTTWTGATASKTFATTTALLKLGSPSAFSGFTRFAHFRLTLQGGGGPSAFPALHYHRQMRA